MLRRQRHAQQGVAPRYQRFDDSDSTLPHDTADGLGGGDRMMGFHT